MHLVKYQNKKTTTVCPFECSVIALPRCVIWSTYTYFCCLDSVVPAITKNETEQSGLNFTFSETPKSGFLLRELKTAVPLYSLCESDIIV